MTDSLINYKLLGILFCNYVYVQTANLIQYYQFFEGYFLLCIFASIASFSVRGGGGFSILTLYPMLVLVQEKSFCHISLVMGYFSDLLKEYGCFLSIIQNLRFLRCYQKYFSPFYDTPHKKSDTLYENLWMR